MATTDRDIEIGKRLEGLRRRAGFTRPQLAGLAAISPETVKKVELGNRRLTLDVARRLAQHLGIRDLGEIYGPETALSLDGRPPHPHVPTVRTALTSWPLAVAGEPQTPTYLDGAVDSAWNNWHSSRHQRSEAGAALPGLITDAQRSVRLLDGNDRRRALAAMSEVYHLGQAYLAWHGDRELMYLCVDRGMSTALDADDPLAIARSSWYAAHLLRSVGRGDEALALLHDARQLVTPLVDDGKHAEAEMLADIELCDGLTRARTGDQGAWARLTRADEIVRRVLPDGYVGVRTRVSSALVDVYAVMYAVDLGDSDEARRLSERLDPARIPSTERRGRHYVELARAADLEGSPEATLLLMQRALATSPETVTYSPVARELARQLARTAPASIRAEAIALATSAGIEI